MADTPLRPHAERAARTESSYPVAGSQLARGLQRALPVVVTLVALLCVWEASKLLFRIPDQKLPHLSAIVETMFSRTQGGNGPLLINQMLLNAWATLRVALAGFALGSMLGIGLALLLSQSNALERGLLPYMIGSQTVPILAIAPMVVVGMGRMGAPIWTAQAVVAAYLTFFPVAIGMLRGLRATSAQSRDLMRSYAASRMQLFWKLQFPASLPYLFTSLKIAATASIIGAIIAELPAGSREGIGVAILTSAQFYNSRPPALYVTILVAALLGVVLYAAVALVEALVLRGRRVEGA